MKKRLAVVASSLIGMALMCSTAAHAKDAPGFEQQLQRQWKGQLKVMRQPCAGDRITFNLRSGPIGACAEYSWADDSVIQIKKIRVTDQGFRIDAQRVSIGFNPKTGKFGRASNYTQVRIEALVGHRPTESADAEEFFTAFTEDARTKIADFAPPHWQLCLRGMLRKDAGRRWTCHYPPNDDWWGKSQPPTQAVVPVFKRVVNSTGHRSYVVENVLVYRVGRDVRPPKEVFTPDPSYPEAARRERKQGTAILRALIDANGQPQDVQVYSPIGSGFDEQSILTVRKWKFEPATFGGKPVPVIVLVEVNFRLY